MSRRIIGALVIALYLAIVLIILAKIPAIAVKPVAVSQEQYRGEVWGIHGVLMIFVALILGIVMIAGAFAFRIPDLLEEGEK